MASPVDLGAIAVDVVKHDQDIEIGLVVGLASSVGAVKVDTLEPTSVSRFQTFLEVSQEARQIVIRPANLSSYA